MVFMYGNVHTVTNNNQKWIVDNNGKVIHCAVHPNLCLDADPTDPGHKVQTWHHVILESTKMYKQCNGGAASPWLNIDNRPTRCRECDMVSVMSGLQER